MLGLSSASAQQSRPAEGSATFEVKRDAKPRPIVRPEVDPGQATRDAATAIRAFGVIVFPADIVLRARRQHIDCVALREAFRRQTARVFRSAENLCPVSLNDERDPHVVIMCMLAFAVCVSHFPVT